MRLAQNIALLALAAACGWNAVSAYNAASEGESWTFIDLPVRAGAVPTFGWVLTVVAALCVLAVVVGAALDRERPARRT